MTLTIELNVEDGVEAARVLGVLSAMIEQRERSKGDAVERKTCKSGHYEVLLPELKSIEVY